MDSKTYYYILNNSKADIEQDACKLINNTIDYRTLIDWHWHTFDWFEASYIKGVIFNHFFAKQQSEKIESLKGTKLNQRKC